MELKYIYNSTFNTRSTLLIVPYGIEIVEPVNALATSIGLLIVPYGIEIQSMIVSFLPFPNY